MHISVQMNVRIRASSWAEREPTASSVSCVVIRAVSLLRQLYRVHLYRVYNHLMHNKDTLSDAQKFPPTVRNVMFRLRCTSDSSMQSKVFLERWHGVRTAGTLLLKERACTSDWVLSSDSCRRNSRGISHNTDWRYPQTTFKYRLSWSCDRE